MCSVRVMGRPRRRYKCERKPRDLKNMQEEVIEGMIEIVV